MRRGRYRVSLWVLMLAAPLGAGCKDKAEELAGPCAGGSWGAILEPEASLHVAEGGTGDGSYEAPLGDLEEALALAAAGTTRRVAVWPGSYTAELYVGPDAADGSQTYDGLALEGCSSEEVTVAAVADDRPVIKVTSARDVRVAGLRLSGGQRGLWVSGAEGVELADVGIEDALVAGVVFDGPITLVDIQGMEVRDTRAEALDSGEVGYGVVIEEAAVTWSGGGIWNSTTAGLLVHSGRVTLEDLTVDGTRARSDGSLGRGIHIQGTEPTLSMSGGQITDSVDAGLFALRPSLLQLSGVTIRGLQSGVVGEVTSGDGIAVSGYDDLLPEDGGPNYDPAGFVVELDGNTIDGAPRAGIYVENVTADLSGNAATGGDCDVCAYEAAVTGDAADELEAGLSVIREVGDISEITSEGGG